MSIIYKKGWNIISVSDKNGRHKNAISFIKNKDIWEYVPSEGYKKGNFLEPGIGYWFRLD